MERIMGQARYEVKHRYIDLSNIPCQIKNGNIQYKWKESAGCTCYFEFGDISGEILIKDTYKKNGAWYLIIQFNDDTYEIRSDAFRRVQLNYFLYSNGVPFKYEIGKHIVDDTRDFTIIDREYRERHTNNHWHQKQKYYLVHCNKCGYECWKSEINIDGKYATGCHACAGLCLCIGFNDIATTDPWMIKYFPGGIDQASQYTKWSTNDVELACPDCGRKRIAKPSNIATIGKLACICQDSMSYPNKFMFNFFTQLGVNVQIEHMFDWSEHKIYDDYIQFEDGRTLICENHGAWHYQEKYFSDGRTLKDQQEIDRLKRELALNNGITYYVELDCRRSEKNLIKESIENSLLSELFDLSLVDYNSCDCFANSNLIKDVCNYKNNNPELFTTDIASYFNISSARVRNYLKRGAEQGWCIYDSTTENVRKSRSMKGRSKRSIPIKCIELDKYYRDSETFIEERSHMGEHYTGSCILDVCRGKQSHHHHLHFQFISKEEFNQIKSESPEKAVGEYFKLAS